MNTASKNGLKEHCWEATAITNEEASAYALFAAPPPGQAVPDQSHPVAQADLLMQGQQENGGLNGCPPIINCEGIDRHEHYSKECEDCQIEEAGVIFPANIVFLFRQQFSDKLYKNSNLHI